MEMDVQVAFYICKLDCNLLKAYTVVAIVSLPVRRIV